MAQHDDALQQYPAPDGSHVAIGRNHTSDVRLWALASIDLGAARCHREGQFAGPKDGLGGKLQQRLWVAHAARWSRTPIAVHDSVCSWWTSDR
jgi:hypothetical protein